jgi:hypothetical protein
VAVELAVVGFEEVDLEVADSAAVDFAEDLEASVQVDIDQVELLLEELELVE